VPVGEYDYTDILVIVNEINILIALVYSNDDNLLYEEYLYYLGGGGGVSHLG